LTVDTLVIPAGQRKGDGVLRELLAQLPKWFRKKA